MPTIELLTNNRSRLLDVKIRMTDLDDLVLKSLGTVQEAYLKPGSEDQPSGPDSSIRSDFDSDGGESTAKAI